MATKFSAFNPIGPSATTECVGLDGATNVRYAIGDIDVSNLTGFPLLINQGGTGQTTQPLALDALTDAASQVADDILYIDGSGASNVAAFINPSQLPNVPVRAVLYASYQPGAGNVNYFNFTNGADVNVPFNSATTNISTDSVAGAYTFTWNGLAGSSGNTNWNVPLTGLYRATVNMHFFDQANGIIVEGFIRNITAGSVDSGMIDDVGNAASGAKTDINYSATGVFSATANDAIEFRIKFTGGSGSPSPFPSVDNNLVTNICIEYIN